MSPNMRNVSVRELWFSIRPRLGTYCPATISQIDAHLQPFYDADESTAPVLIRALRQLEAYAETCRGSVTFELSRELRIFREKISVIPAKVAVPWTVYEDDIRSELMKVYRGKPQDEATALVNTVIQAIKRVKQ